MDVEQLKSGWKEYNRKLSISRRINEQVVLSMLRERSRSRVSGIRRDNTILLVWMCFLLVMLAAVFAGNPFDFVYAVQYIPFGLLTIGVVLAIVSLVRSLSSFNVNLNNSPLDIFLKRTIKEYEKNRKTEAWFGLFIFSSGVLTVFSFLPQKLENNSTWRALGETAIMAGITLLIYFVAYKLGAFKNTRRQGFANDLSELTELKSMAAELGDGQ